MSGVVVVRSWSELTTDELYDVVKLRTDVFYLEQKVDDEELDNRDREDTTRHYWIADDSGTASYLRVLVDTEPEHADAHHVVGRVVVRADRRGEGLAQRLFERVIEDFGHVPMMLHAQDYIVPLYRRFGFVEFGEPYLEAGIVHQSMYRPGPGAPE
jgi:ElaA protein